MKIVDQATSKKIIRDKLERQSVSRFRFWLSVMFYVLGVSTLISSFLFWGTGIGAWLLALSLLLVLIGSVLRGLPVFSDIEYFHEPPFLFSKENRKENIKDKGDA